MLFLEGTKNPSMLLILCGCLALVSLLPRGGRSLSSMLIGKCLGGDTCTYGTANEVVVRKSLFLSPLFREREFGMKL